MNFKNKVKLKEIVEAVFEKKKLERGGHDNMVRPNRRFLSAKFVDLLG